MSEFIRDVECPGCGFPLASGYGSGEQIHFSVCGYCNFDSSTGESPTPELVHRQPWGEMARWLKAEKQYRG